MPIEERLHHLLKETRKVVRLAERAEEADEEGKRKAAVHLLSKLSALDQKEIEEMNELLSDIRYEDPEVIDVVDELSEEMHEIVELVESIEENPNVSKQELYDRLKDVASHQGEVEEAFSALPAAAFEEELEKSGFFSMEGKDPKKKIRDLQKLVKVLKDKSDIENAELFYEIYNQMGPKRLKLFIEKMFFLLEKGNKAAKKLYETYPDSGLFQQAEKLKGMEVVPATKSIPKKFGAPYPNVGYPTGTDLMIIAACCKFFKTYIAMISGGLFNGFFTGVKLQKLLVTGSILVAITFYFWHIDTKRYNVLAKRALNLISLFQQGGTINDIYAGMKVI